MIGLLCVLVVGGCVASVRGCARVIDPKVWSERVDEEPVKTRRMLGEYMRTATYELDGGHQVRGRATTVAVQDFTDGSVHLTLDGIGKRLVEVVAKVEADGDRSKVEVISDATALAAATDGNAAALHRQIQEELERALDAIDRHQTLPGGFSMTRLIKLADGEREYR